MPTSSSDQLRSSLSPAICRAAVSRRPACWREVDYGNHTPEPGRHSQEDPTAGDVNAALECFNPQEQGFKRTQGQARRTSRQRQRRAPTTAFRTAPSSGPARGTRACRRCASGSGCTASRTMFSTTASCSTPSGACRRQRHRGRPASIDNKTLDAINGPSARARTSTRCTATMERWRWLPRDLGRTYVMVNIPDYTLKVVNEHKVIWRTKIVAGKPQTPTPLLSRFDGQRAAQSVLVRSAVDHPERIAAALRQRSKHFRPHGPRSEARRRRQHQRGAAPGAANALGRIKFNFPNKFQVYLHDTPEKRLFAADKRAFSHGCMRVENPTKFGEIMLQLAMNGPDAERAADLSPSTARTRRTYKLVDRPSVYLTYQTAFVDDAGKLQLRDDIYGFDARINAIMHSRRAPRRRYRAAAGSQARRRDRQGQPGNPAAGSSGARRRTRSRSLSRCSARNGGTKRD